MPNQRQVFNDFFAKDTERFHRELEKYKATGALDAWKERVGLSQAQKKRQEDKVHFLCFVDWDFYASK